jgi:hypothetical protein
LVAALGALWEVEEGRVRSSLAAYWDTAREEQVRGTGHVVSARQWKKRQASQDYKF